MKHVLVTGGGGCLGSHTLEYLNANRSRFGITRITVLDLSPSVRNLSSSSDPASFQVDRWITGSICDADLVRKALEDDVRCVIHVASVVDTGTMSRELIYRVNVKGTETLVACCQAQKSVKALVYSSSMDVVVVNSDFCGVDGGREECCKYAMDVSDLKEDVYAISKTLAEKMVLQANRSVPHLRTAACRPVGIYGERDMVHIGNVLKAARDAGASNLVRIGNGAAVFQHVYARNCAQVHVMCAYKLCLEDDNVAGQAFFAIDDTKVNNFFDFFEPYMAAMQYKIPSIRLSMEVLYPLADIAEDCFRALQRLGLFKEVQYVFTRRAVHDTCVIEWFHTDKARRLLGYEPEVKPEEARRRSIEDFANRLEFPKGKYVHPENKYWYKDDGSDYRPDSKLFLQLREQVQERKRFTRQYERSHFSMMLTLSLAVATGGALAHCMRRN